ncbi:MAG: glycosyltransferase family 2 protein [Methyloversatilis sp.]|uniref:glycosyltransferase family 2 protein n=1 Tax=Methyloversatilis sp. TaxID=2569862 RepID=UPI0027327DA7|nr:glycosyltransferase family 2 protein [Methyloversatilis sp.]MDP3871357.1 glycosyltransferase family 2 protein [Methyloversatilis sp.]
MSAQPSVLCPQACAVVIVAWNCWDVLHDCLGALSQQTVQDFRVIVIDNGDATTEQIASLESYPRLVYARSPSNVGFSAANNHGISLADDCTWIALLNPDTRAEPLWLETLLAAARRHPDCAMFASRLLQAWNPELLDGDGDRYHVSGFAWRDGFGLPAANRSAAEREVFSPCAAAALYSRHALIEVGGFDEDFFCYMEDVDLGFRLRLAGYRCLLVPAARVHHIGSGTTSRRSAFCVYHGHRNLVWVYVKNMPGLLFWIFLPFHLVLNIAGVLRYLPAGAATAILRAKFDALCMLARMLRKRRRIQQLRTVGLIGLLKAFDRCPVPGVGRALNSLWK